MSTATAAAKKSTGTATKPAAKVKKPAKAKAEVAPKAKAAAKPESKPEAKKEESKPSATITVLMLCAKNPDADFEAILKLAKSTGLADAQVRKAYGWYKRVAKAVQLARG
jgi:hypothetical protein